MNIKAQDQNESITFDLTITTKNDLTKSFCIFTDPTRNTKNPAQCWVMSRTKLRHLKTKVYTDGTCTNNGKQNSRSGSRVWFSPNVQKNSAIKIPGEDQSNQAGEIITMILALSTTPTFCPLEIISDFKYTIDGLTTHLIQWKSIGWIQIKNATLF